MLDTVTKRRIDTARDILVGKVPDPKSQVEQITIALIYKFMDDMDAEAEELGGRRRFFAGEFARYGWAALMRGGLGGHEVLNLYAEAIARMPQNPGIPPLFRDIFKNAFLPYRDPETLRVFLKIVDEFAYDHSERLGDAFEYLLSVLSSQGDAGQFRTPRHIIDFIVAVLDPQKHETVLDPACGTAGFLISSYKHILRANAGRATESTNRTGNLVDPVPPVANTLTPDERARLAANFKGYDISPDMVRLSLVNLYLHGFTDPHIAEYDTLTSLERWNEYADVILANPPFMSPKGGIKPHNRFSVQSKRSEVLFVDYMAEHLTPNGRAGIIVPEGIVFQSQTAYRQLRKLLVEEHLVAVVSLPAGVFNPYSGVKTSILILDKALAKKAGGIAFFKVENDGYGLGAQRRPIDKDDLPQARAEIAEYLRRLRLREPLEDFRATLGRVVAKEKIAAGGEYNLSGERYEPACLGKTEFPLVPLGEVAELIRGITFSKADQLAEATLDSLLVATTRAAQESGIVAESLYHIPRALLVDENKLLRDGDILISTANSLGLLGRTTHVKSVSRPMSFGAFMSVIRPGDRVLSDYLIRVLRTPFAIAFFVRNANTTTNISNLNLSALARFTLPLPSVIEQEEIVAEIERYQKVIDGARTVVDNYRPSVRVGAKCPIARFGDAVETLTPPKKIPKADFWPIGRFPVIDQSKVAVAGKTDDETALVDGRGGLVIFGDHTCAVKFVEERFAQGADGIKIIKPNRLLLPKFVYFYLVSHPIEQDGYKRHFSKLAEISIPIPPLETQRAIVAEIEAEQALVDANRELIARMERKIQATLARVWGEAETGDGAAPPV